MPELAEVEFYRKQWDSGLGKRIRAVHLHARARVFQHADPTGLGRALEGATLQISIAHGKQMLFRFSGGHWLGVHLGMTGQLRTELPDFGPGRHDHLALLQAGRTLVFSDPRQFGKIRFHTGEAAPDWWSKRASAVTAREFTCAAMEAFLCRHGRLPIKAALLLQDGFPGIGNWMADEIMWRARLHPRSSAGCIRRAKAKELWRWVRWVSRQALAIIGKDFSDPPRGWLIHERWTAAGVCPVHRVKLQRATIGGRTTAWCAQCQSARRR